MPSIKSLRTKVLLSALVPGTVMLVVVAVIALYAYERIAKDVVQQRDTELARVSAARMSEALARHSRLLQITAADEDVRSMEPALVLRGLKAAQSQLTVFDAGVVAYNAAGVAVQSDSLAEERRNTPFPLPVELGKVKTTRRTSFSNMIRDPASGEDVVLITVPVAGTGTEFNGVLAGFASVKRSLLGATYAEVLEFNPGRSGFAYLVDGNGKLLYHRHASLLGTSLLEANPVGRAITGETGAVVTEDLDGETVVSGFAPVPNTSWAIVTQERWDNVVGPIRGYNKVLLGLLVLGGAVALGLILLAIGRILRPVKELTEGAQRLAAGDFDHMISAETGDEIQVLATQFNAMAGALKESYGELEGRVAARTEELRDSEERYRTLFEQSADAIFLSVEGRIVDVNQAALTLFGYTRDEAIGIEVGEVFIDPVDREHFREQLRDQGTLRDFEARLRRRDGTEFDCLLTASLRADDDGRTAAVQGIIRDVTEQKEAQETLLEQTREVAVLEERNRMAREIHDTMAQGFTGIVLQLEAGEQALDETQEETLDHLGRAKTLARECLQAARRSVWNLLPRALEERPLSSALEEEIRQFTAVNRERAVFDVSGDARDLKGDVQTALLRICQQALTNVRSHAQATEVTVALSYTPDSVQLEIRDNGVGFDPDATRDSRDQSGFGLAGMEQRARLLGGDLNVTSKKGGGTRVEVKVPTR